MLKFLILICLGIGVTSCDVTIGKKPVYDCVKKETELGKFVADCRENKEDTLTHCIRSGKQIFCKEVIEPEEKK